MMLRILLSLFVLLNCLPGVRGEVISFWSFNSLPPDNNTDTGTLLPVIGTGTAQLVGGVTATFTASNGSSDTATDNSNWRITTWPAQSTGNKSHGVRFALATTGFRNLRINFDLRNSNTASKYARLQYTTNGLDFLDHTVITMSAETWVNEQSVSLASVPGVADNPDFGFRIVTEFQNTATGLGPASYAPANSSSSYGLNGTLRFDMVMVSGDHLLPDAKRTITLLNYNVWGAGATNWSTNNPQVRAIGRQLAHLAPDIVTLQEVPHIGLPQLPDFVAAYLPGFFSATNRLGDGDKGNLILSRFPILRSRSHLGRSSLVQWGYDGVFTRDLFEAEIAVPGWNEPLHAFSIHLKAFNDPESGPRRAAEASAVSNYFATVFRPAKGHRPHVLAGDFNEDIARPRSYEQDAMPRVINDATGLQLTTPRNPFNNDERTWSSRNSAPTIRFDYILPGQLLFQNTVTNWIFRTDFLNPTPPSLMNDDSQTASDHLPLVAIYANPYCVWPPFQADLRVEDQTVRVTWGTVPGMKYIVRGSINLTNWFDVSSVIPANDTNLTWNGSSVPSGMFFRVQITP